LLAVCGRHEHDAHRRMSQGETVPLASGGRREARRVIVGLLTQSAPALRRISDDGDLQAISNWERVLLGAAVGRVVTDHQKVELAGFSPLRAQLALMGRKTDEAHLASRPRVLQRLERPAWSGDLLPFLLSLNVVERDDVDPIDTERPQGPLDLACC